MSDNKKASIIAKLELDEVSLVDDPANPGALVSMFKRNEGPMPETTTTPASAPAADASVLANLQTEIARLTEENTTLRKSQEPAPTATPVVVEPAKIDVEALLKSHNELKAELMAVREASLTATFVAKVADINLPTTPEALAGLLKRVHTGATTDADATELLRLFKAASQKTDNLTKSLGTTAVNDTPQVLIDLNKRVETIQTANAKLTREQAMLKAFHDDPKLYDAYTLATTAAKASMTNIAVAA